MATAATLTPAQIAGHARAAGVTNPAALVIAVAVALAESGGQPRITHQNTDRHRSVDYGLWQINGFWHPSYDKQQLLDPAYNAKAMAAISKNGTDWSAWATVSNGRYKDKVAEATAGVESAGVQLPLGAKGSGWIDGFIDVATGLIGGGAAGKVDSGDVPDVVKDPLASALEEFARPLLAITLVGVFVAGGLIIAGVGLSKLSPMSPDQAAQAALTVAPLAL